MSVSCVILNYNDWETTINLVEVIRNYPSLDYIIIVDNASTNDSCIHLKKIAHGKVILLCSKVNGGYGYGNNICLNYAYETLNSEYGLIANPDVFFLNSDVERLCQVLKEDERCAVSSSVPYTKDGKPQLGYMWDIPTVSQYVLSMSLITRNFWHMYYPKAFIENKLVCEPECVCGAMLMVKLPLFMQAGMFDEDIFLYCEETVLGIRLKRCGFKTKLSLDQGYIHYHSASIDKVLNQERKLKLLFKSKLIVLRKYYGIGKIKEILVRTFFAIVLIEKKLGCLLKKKGKVSDVKVRF